MQALLLLSLLRIVSFLLFLLFLFRFLVRQALKYADYKSTPVLFYIVPVLNKSTSRYTH